ncbi:hypothetical protein RB653_006616 [Dictyostelium firmibasis]|uniref:alpha-1,3-mannosyl-glycoprotein 2-beta-N-acetylglucosaminyltransferase n=1 Tax=Dictyostelium firmibasis TaxID=79012 RepID=A0AAN7TUF1_9MYCE
MNIIFKTITVLLLLLFIIINIVKSSSPQTPTLFKNEEIIDNSNDVKVILIMTFKRMNDFSKCLDSIISANHSSEYHLVLTQSVSMNDYKDYNLLEEILNEKIKQNSNNKEKKLFKSITHIDTESSSKQPYGNAYFAFKNLVYGMKYTVGKLFPNLQSLIIFEEDVEISKDVFEFFESSKSIMKTDKSIKFATTAFFLHTTHPQYNWLLDKPIKRKSIRNENSLSLLIPNQLNKVTLNGEIEFKVLSWLIDRSIIDQLILDFNIIENWVIENNFEDKIENKPNTSKPELLINNCDCWNHDRYLELRFKGLKFIGSQSPRCNHIPVGGFGLSSVLDDYGFPVNQQYIKSDSFVMGTEFNGEKGIWGIVKEFLPKFECPSKINCYNNVTNQYCGTLKVSTCLNVWGPLQCVPCSGRQTSTLDPQCNLDFSSCCDKDNCSAHNPFFISMPSLH